jgi:CTD small phosphatase-like protein 2
VYADLIIDQIDPEKKYFKHRLYRQHCYNTGEVFVKDLRIVQDRSLDEIILVDNSILSFAFQINNGVPICSFYS